MTVVKALNSHTQGGCRIPKPGVTQSSTGQDCAQADLRWFCPLRQREESRGLERWLPAAPFNIQSSRFPQRQLHRNPTGFLFKQQ